LTFLDHRVRVRTVITTLELPEDIVAQANGVARKRKTTLQALVLEGLRTVLRNSTPCEADSREALARLRSGFHLGGGKPLTRDEAHAR
jgi:hypothetical protein